MDDKDLRKLIKELQRKKKGGRFSKFIVTLVILLNVIFTSAILYVFLETDGSEPSTLIASWFAFTTVELWSLSKIKRVKVKEDE